MKVFFISPEIQPFAETDFIAQFAKKFSSVMQEEKHDIRLIMPKYSFISERKYILREVIRLREITVPWGNGTLIASIKSAFIPNTKVQVYFLQQDSYFANLDERIYKAKGAHKALPDSDLKFTFFCKAAIESLKYLHWQPDIIHCCGWQSSMIPMLMKSIYSKERFYSGIHSVFDPFSARDIASYGPEAIKTAKIGENGNTDVDIEYNKKGFFSPIAEGIRHSDLVLVANHKNRELTKSLKGDKTFGALIKTKKKRFKSLLLSSDESDSYQKLAREISDLYKEISKHN